MRKSYNELGDEDNWPLPVAYSVGSVFVCLFLSLLVFALRNLRRQLLQPNNRHHLAVVHSFVAVLAGTRMLLVLLGTMNSSSFFASLGEVPELLTHLLDSLCYGSLLGACFFELAMFIRLGWAATLQIKNLSQAHKLMNFVYIACALGITDELVVGVLLSVQKAPHLAVAILVGVELVAIGAVLLVLLSTLLDVAKLIASRKQSALTGAKWSPPLDIRDIALFNDNVYTPPRNNNDNNKRSASPDQQNQRCFGTAVISAILLGFRGLPKRARIAFVAVVVGLTVVAAQCSERLVEAVFAEVGTETEGGPEPSHIVFRCLEVLVGFAISRSSSVISTQETVSDTNNNTNANNKFSSSSPTLVERSERNVGVRSEGLVTFVV